MSIEGAALDNMCSGTSDDDMNLKLNDITVVNILMDLGPSCTTNAATFRVHSDWLHKNYLLVGLAPVVVVMRAVALSH